MDMRNIDTYRPPTDVVHKEMMNPRITNHHHPATCKYRSPVLSGMHLSAEEIAGDHLTCVPGIYAAHNRGEKPRRP